MRLNRFLALVVIGSIATYPVPDLRLAVGEMRFPAYVPLMATLAVACFATITLQRRRIAYPRLLWLALLLLFAGLVTSTLYVGELDTELAPRYALFFLTPLLFYQVLREGKALRAATGLILAATVLVTLYGYYGYLTGRVGSSIEHGYGYWGIRYLPSSRNSDVLYPAVGLVVLMAWLRCSWRRCAGLLRLGSLVLAGLLLFAVIACQSRSGWVMALVALGAVLLPGRGRRQSRAWMVLLAGLVIAALAVAPGQNRAAIVQRALAWDLSDPSLSNGERLTLLVTAGREALACPWGMGFDRMALHLQEAGLGTHWAENTYLNTMLELGWGAGLGIVAYSLFPIRRLRRCLQGAPGPHTWVYLAYFGLSTGLAVFMLFNVETVSMFYWIVSSLAVACTGMGGRPQKETPHGARAVAAGQCGDCRPQRGGLDCGRYREHPQADLSPLGAGRGG